MKKWMLFLLICSLTIFIYGCGNSSSSENTNSSEALVTPRPFLENTNVSENDINKQHKETEQEKQLINNDKKSRVSMVVSTLTSNQISNNNVIAISDIDNDGFLSIIAINKKSYFAVYNNNSNIVALIEYNIQLMNPEKYSNEQKPLQFNLMVSRDNKNNKDNLLGYWEDTIHIIPIQVYTKVENNKLIPLGIFSYKGKELQEFNEYLYEQQNVNLVNTFITHVDSLNKYIKDNNINL